MISVIRGAAQRGAEQPGRFGAVQQPRWESSGRQAREEMEKVAASSFSSSV